MRAFCFVLIGSAFVASMLGCSNRDDSIKAETAGTGGSTHSSSHAAQGAVTSGSGGTSSTGSGSACCADPVTIGGQVKVVAAADDPAQAVIGTWVHDAVNVVKVQDGPFVLTDVFTLSGFFNLDAYPSTDCTGNRIVLVESPVAPTQYQLHGAHLLVPAGWSLCVEPGGATANYAGYKPY